MKRVLLLVLAWLIADPAAGARPPLAVATLEPLRLIIESLAAKRVDTLTLIPANAVHHGGLRPSQLRVLRQADLLLWVGPELEADLASSVARLPATTRVISTRQVLQGSAAAGTTSAQYPDPHIWLDPVLVQRLAQPITAALIELAPGHAAEFNTAQQAFVADTEALERHLQKQFEALRDAGLLVSHDAYSHFVARFGLRQLAALRDQQDRTPGARRVARFRQAAVSGAAKCLLADHTAAFEPIDTLVADMQLARVVLEPAGPAAQDWTTYHQYLAWFADGLANCLGGSSD